jgi:hypothetical protein
MFFQFRTRRETSMSAHEWRRIVLADRRDRIDRLAVTLGDVAVAPARAAMARGDVHAVDAELTLLGHKP